MSRLNFSKAYSKGKFFMEIILSSKYLWKRNRFSIVIVNMWDSKWMTYPELSFDVTDGHGLKWCIKMDIRLFVLIYLSPCFIKLGVVQLCIFCVVMQITETWVVWKQTVPCIMHILILEVCRFFVWFYRKNVVVITRWCKFCQQRSELTQFQYTFLSFLLRFPFVHSDWLKRTGSGQFKWKGPRHACTLFPPQLSKFPHFGQPEWENWAALIHEQGPFWPEPVLRTCAFHLRTDWSDRPDLTNGMRP